MIKVSGLRTLLIAGSFLVIGVLDVLGTVDLSTLIGHWVPDKDQVGFYVALAGLVMGLLRMITKTPVGVRDVDAIQSDAGYMKHNIDDAGAK